MNRSQSTVLRSFFFHSNGHSKANAIRFSAHFIKISYYLSKATCPEDESIQFKTQVRFPGIDLIQFTTMAASENTASNQLASKK